MRLSIVLACALAALVAACSPASVLNALTRADTYDAREDLSYGPDLRQKLDVFRPRSRPPAGGYPLVVFFYGGSWNRGDRKDYKFVAEALASEGVVTVLADYRLYPQVRYPEFLEDCARAVAWARREAPNFGADPAKLFVLGHSAGAYNAAMIALDRRWLAREGMTPGMLAGWIGLAGPYDFLPSENPSVRPVFGYPHYPAGSQPVEYASGTSTRTFLGAAASDSVVDPTRNTRQLADKLQIGGTDVTLRMYSGVSHLTLVAAFARPLRRLAPVLADVSEFISQSAASALKPEVFFAGHTRGEGTLTTLAGSRRSLRVEGHGYTEADGAFRLDQTVTFSNGETETRTWRLLKRDANHYSGTLSGVAGEVDAEATGNLFHLRYLLRRPAVYMEQWLYLQPDGRTVLNQATVTVLGVPWARLSEEIKKSDEASSRP